jgi:hypothetical protein
MSRLLVATLGLAAVAAVPAGAAHADTCVVTPTTGTTASVCVASEGVSIVPGPGVTSASRVSVSVNGTTYQYCIARTTVSPSGVYHDPRTIYPC